MYTPYDEHSRDELLDVIHEYERMITWGTDCISCANMLDRIYELDVTIQKVNDILAAVPVESRNTNLGRIYSTVEPHIWGK